MKKTILTLAIYSIFISCETKQNCEKLQQEKSKIENKLNETEKKLSNLEKMHKTPVVKNNSSENFLEKSQKFKSPLNFNNVLENLLVFNSHKELEKEFGKENLKIESTSNLKSNDKYFITILFPNTKNEISFFWKNKKKLKTLEYIKISENNTRWLTENDLRIGLRIIDLKKINQQHFSVHSFENKELAGKINWKKGFLSNKKISAKLSTPKFDLSSHLDKASFESYSKFKKTLNSSGLKNYDTKLSEIILWKQ